MPARLVQAACLRADWHCPFGPVLRVAYARQGRPGDRGNEAAVIALPALRLSAHPHLPAARGPGDGNWSVPSVFGARPSCSCRASGRGGASPPPAQGRCRRGPPIIVWAYDFVFDACANGQQIKCLTIVDEFTHECLAIDVAGSIRSGRVIEVLARLISLHGAPVYLRSDSGPEFVSQAILKWLHPEPHRDRADRSGQAVAERHQRVVQRQIPRRVSEPGVVPHAARSESRDRDLAPALQRGAPAYEPELLDPASSSSSKIDPHRFINHGPFPRNKRLEIAEAGHHYRRLIGRGQSNEGR